MRLSLLFKQKPYIQILFGALLVSLFFPVIRVSAAGRAIFQLLPSGMNVEKDANFDITVSIDPAGENLDTARLSLGFNPEMVRMESFQLGDVFPEVAPGNKIDNDAGMLSTGGFSLTAPIKEKGIFGILTLRALKVGTTALKILPDSRLIAAGVEKIELSSSVGATIKIIENAKQPDGALIVESVSHPDPKKWYQKKEALWQWSAKEGVTVKNYWVGLDHLAITTPKKDKEHLLPAAQNRYQKEGLSDGIWYFHLQAQDQNGTYTDIAQSKIQIDTTAPRVFSPSMEKIQFSEGEAVEILFATTDDTSGIKQYATSLNNGQFASAESPVILKNLKPGNYFFEVRAEDFAGNIVYGQKTFRVYPVIGKTLNQDIQQISYKRLWIIFLSFLFLSAIITIILKKRTKL